MRKLFYSLFATLAVIALVGCSSNSPRNVAEKAIDCSIKEDYRGFLDLVYFSESDKEKKEGYIQMIEEKAKKNKKENAPKIESYEFVSEDVDEEAGKAKVVFEVNYDNGKTHEQTIDLVKVDGKWYINMKK